MFRSIYGAEYGFLVSADRAYPGEAVLPSVCPSLLSNYHSLQIHSLQDIKVALRDPESKIYRRWNEQEWVDTDEPEFMDRDTVNQGLGCWFGYLQIHLQLGANAQLQSVDLSYEVGCDIQDWLLRFGLPEFFRSSVKLERTLYCHDGRNLTLPSDLDMSQLSDLRIKPHHEKPRSVDLNLDCKRIILDEPIAPGSVRLLYTLEPKVEYVYGEHQISELPVIILRSLGEAERRDWIEEYAVGDSLNRLDYYYNLDFELRIVSGEPVSARAIAHHLYSKIKHEARLYAQPFDLELAVANSGGLSEHLQDELEGSIPSITMRGRVLNLFVTHSRSISTRQSKH